MTKFLRVAPLSLSFAALLAISACSSQKTPQDVCNCLNKQADAYLAKHSDLTKAQLESSGNEIMTEILGPCKAMSDEAEQQLKTADLESQTKTKEQMQTCLNALGEKMKAGAKEESASKDDDAADDQASAAEAAADRIAADIEAGKTPVRTSSSEMDEASTGSVSDEEWNEMISNYTAYVNQYAVLMKKSAKGDMSAMSEAAGVMTKSQELEEQLKEYGGKATAAQNARFAKAQAKAMQTMMGVQK